MKMKVSQRSRRTQRKNERGGGLFLRSFCFQSILLKGAGMQIYTNMGLLPEAVIARESSVNRWFAWFYYDRCDLMFEAHPGTLSMETAPEFGIASLASDKYSGL